MKKNIFGITSLFIILLTSFTTNLSANTSEWTKHKKATYKELDSIHGWCSEEKADKLMDFIFENTPETFIEIGSYGGSATYAIISAMQYVGKGKVFAVDAWDNQAAIEGLDPTNTTTRWWRKVDLNKIYVGFIELLMQKNLTDWCEAIRLRSDQAVTLFEDESIDAIYIDGNSSNGGSLNDVLLYYPKIKKGGYIWLNNANAKTKMDALIFLMNKCTWVQKKSIENKLVVFKK